MLQRILFFIQVLISSLSWNLTQAGAVDVVTEEIVEQNFFSEENTRTLQIEDYLDWEWVSDPQISPDGKTIIYTRKHVNKQQDCFESELWIMDADGKRNRRLMEKAGSEVSWSPDGTRIAYIAKADNSSDIFVRWMDATGNITRITQGANRPSSLSWSPDGGFIAFRAFVPVPNSWDIDLPGRPAGATWAEEATVVDTLHYRKDGVGIKARGYKHIFIVSAEGGRPQQVTEGAWHVGTRPSGHDTGADLSWLPDGKTIVFSANREPDADIIPFQSALYAVEVATGSLRRITSMPDFAEKPRVSPNGELIAYIGMNKTTESNFPDRELHIVGVDGTNDRVLVRDKLGFMPWAIYWAKDGRGLYYAHDKEGATNVSYVSLDGKQRRVTTGPQSLFPSSVSDNGVVVGTRTTVDRPLDVVRFDLATGRDMWWLTAVNDDVLDGIGLGQVEEIWYDSTDNTRIQGWIVYPPDFDPTRKYPLVLDIHGGPEDMYKGDWSWTFPAFRRQDYAAQGYVVLYTNPRGSSGYGGEFARAIYNAYPGHRDYQDLMHGVDTIVAKGFIDKERMYIEGCSGGGILTAWVVTQTDRFAGAAAMCPAVNAISKAGTSDIPAYNFNRFSKRFWDAPATWLEHSAIMHVNKVKTPTLLMVGENDLRTTASQPAEFYTALKLLGVPTKLILLKGEAHATWLFEGGRPSNFIRSQLYNRKWFSQWQRMENAEGPAWQLRKISNEK